MDKITVVVRDSGKTIKAEFDNEGKCTFGSRETVADALAVLDAAAEPAEPAKPAKPAKPDTSELGNEPVVPSSKGKKKK